MPDNDSLAGGASNDTLDGGAGDDTLTGGAGSDTFQFGPDGGNDTITDFVAGVDVIDLTAFADITTFVGLTLTSDSRGTVIDLTAYGGGTVLLEGVGIEQLSFEDFRLHGWTYGTDNADTLDGTGADDRIAGDEGNDSIDGGDGYDTIRGGAGDDSIDGGARDDYLRGNDGQDTIEGGSGADIIWGGAGNDSLSGGEGADWIIAGTGNDTIEGGGDADWLGGDAGDDVLYGGGGSDRLDGADGADTLWGGAGNDTLNADGVSFTARGDDSLHGGEGDDALFGGLGADTLEGGAGNDVLQGDIPSRTIRGREFSYETSIDTFVFAPGHGDDTIRHFVDDEDLIDLSSFSGISGFDDLTIISGENGATIDLTGHGGGTIVVGGFDVDDLDASDFVFLSPDLAVVSDEGL